MSGTYTELYQKPKVVSTLIGGEQRETSDLVAAVPRCPMRTDVLVGIQVYHTTQRSKTRFARALSSQAEPSFLGREGRRRSATRFICMAKVPSVPQLEPRKWWPAVQRQPGGRLRIPGTLLYSRDCLLGICICRSSGICRYNNITCRWCGVPLYYCT